MFGFIRMTFTLFSLTILTIGLCRHDLSTILIGAAIVTVAIFFNNRYSKQGLMQRQTAALEKWARERDERTRH